MAEVIKHLTASELKDLRALRALILEAHGILESMDSLDFAVGLSSDDVLSAFGLASSEWAHERLAQIRASLDAPVEVSDLDHAIGLDLVDAA